MPTTSRAAGPTAERVAQNVRHLRSSQKLSLQALSDRLSTLGQPISLGQLSKLENGDRRVDVDDLMALAVALGVSPTRLLLPQTAGPEDTDLTPVLMCSERQAWRWAAGVEPLPAHPGAMLDLDRVQEFQRQCAPHEAQTEKWTLEQLVEHQRVVRPFRDATRDALDDGVPEDMLRSLIGFVRADLGLEGSKRRGKR